MTLVRCDTCRGLGYTHAAYHEACAPCGGRGVLIRSYTTCEKCEGTGERYNSSCINCKGLGLSIGLLPLTSAVQRIPMATLRDVWVQLIDRDEDTDLADVLKGSEFPIGLVLGLHAMLADKSRFLRALSEDGFCVFDGTGVWVEGKGGVYAKLWSYEMEAA